MVVSPKAPLLENPTVLSLISLLGYKDCSAQCLQEHCQSGLSPDALSSDPVLNYGLAASKHRDFFLLLYFCGSQNLLPSDSGPC